MFERRPLSAFFTGATSKRAAGGWPNATTPGETIAIRSIQ